MVHSKRKGAGGERAAAAEIARLFRTDARRGQQFSGSPDSPDIVTGLPNLHFEVKRCETLRLWPALEQAIADAGNKVPVVLHRANHRPWILIVRLDDVPRLCVDGYLQLAAIG